MRTNEKQFLENFQFSIIFFVIFERILNGNLRQEPENEIWKFILGCDF